MNKQVSNLQHLIAKGMIDLDDFYCVTFWEGKIALQGQLSTSEKAKEYSEFFDFRIGKSNGYLEATAEIDGVWIDITFTF